jgi:methylthioribose-1-phosphate isomerase
MRKQEIYVEITTEKERLRAIEILNKSGERIWNYQNAMEINIDCRYLVYCEDGDWLVSPRLRETKITLNQLEEMLMSNSKMKRQTAVEWLVANIDWQLIKNTSLHYEMIVNKAKEMEREQIEEAYQMGREGLTITEFNETFNP